MASNDQLIFLSAQVVPAFFAYHEIIQAGTAALLNPVAGAICTALASGILAKLGEVLGSAYIPSDSIPQPYKAYLIPSIWVISSLLTTLTQFPVRFITAVAPVITLVGAITLVTVIALGALYIIKNSFPEARSGIRNLVPEARSEIRNPVNTLDIPQVILAANRVLGDIAELNKSRGLNEFSYTVPKNVNGQSYHSIEINSYTRNDKEAAIAALHQKIARHIEGMGVIIAPAEHLNWGLRTYGDNKRTFYTVHQALQDSQTKAVIAQTTFDINHTDLSTFPLLGCTIKGKFTSEIVMKPFKAVS